MKLSSVMPMLVIVVFPLAEKMSSARVVFREDFENQVPALTDPVPIGLGWVSENAWDLVSTQTRFGGSSVLEGKDNPGVYDGKALPLGNYDLLDSANIEVTTLGIASSRITAERRITGWSTNQTHLADDSQLTAANGALFAVRWRSGNTADDTNPEYGGNGIEYYDGSTWIKADPENFGAAFLTMDAVRIEVDFSAGTYDMYGARGDNVATLGPEMLIIENQPLFSTTDRLVNVTINRDGKGGTNRRWAYFDDLEIETVANTMFPDGDVNLDGVVDLDTDYATIRDNFFTQTVERTDGDLTGDGTVDLSDFLVWIDNAPPAVAAEFRGVPEPSTGSLVAMGFAALAFTRRRRKIARKVMDSQFSAGRSGGVASLSVFAMVLSLTCWANNSHAQVTMYWQPTDEPGDWSLDDNWNNNNTNDPASYVPDAFANEVAQINNGGTAQVTSTVTEPGRVTLGPGTVEIKDGGTLPVISDVGGINGRFLVNRDGAVVIESGGTIDTHDLMRINRDGTLSVAGNLRVGTLVPPNVPDLQIAAGSAIFQTGADVDVKGRVVVQTDGQLTIESGVSGTWSGFEVDSRSTYTQRLGTGMSPIRVDGGVKLDGLVNLDFSNVSGAAGDRFDLFDAEFADSKDAELVPIGAALSLGQVLKLDQVSGGANGVLIQAVIDSQLILEIDRGTNVGTFKNPNGLVIDMNSYVVKSESGSLRTGTWNGLDDQGSNGNSWSKVGNLSEYGLAELNPTSSMMFGENAELSLGTMYSPNFTEFGQDAEDLVFKYGTPDGRELDGLVIYTGEKQENGLVLNVDPTTGDALIKNESAFDTSLTGYSIESESGSLLPGNWQKIPTSGFWLGSGTALKLEENSVAGGEAIESLLGFELGMIFNGSANRDLTFEYKIAGVTDPLIGSVLYGPLPPFGGGGPASDFNGDGAVDALDAGVMFGVWGQNDAQADLNGDSIVDAADAGIMFAEWTGDSSPVQSVPEPHLPFAALMFFAFTTRRSFRPQTD